MTRYPHMSRFTLGRVPRLWMCMASTVFVCLLGALTALALDTDNDGMQDDYESFFGLNPSSAADAQLNYDTDALTNLEESVLWTDPYVGDTDNDGWNDDVDVSPLSRAVIEWGHPDFTDGDNYSYTGPAWWLSAVRDGGMWSNAGWHVSAAESSGVGALLVGIDRGIVTSSIAYEVTLLDHAGSQLYVDILDTSSVVVASDLVGNLVGGTDLEVVQNLTIPLDTYPSAAIIKLRRGVGEVTVYRSVLYIDQDGDGLDLDQELQLGTSDSNPDTTSPQIYCQGASADAQVLSNAGFEAGAGSGSQNINDWYLFGNVYHEAVNPRTGVMHAKLFGNFTSSVNYSGIYQDHAALSGELWRGVVRVMTSSTDALSGNNHVIVKLEFFDSSYQFLGAVESDALDASMLHDAYMPLVVTGNTPTDTVVIRLAILFIQESDNAGGSIYIDDARLEKIETDLTVSCSADIPASDSSVIIATDNTDPDPLITLAGSASSGAGCGGDPLLVTRTWRATDEAGNVADCSVLYRYEDDEAPVITVEQPDANYLLNTGFEDGASPGTTVPTNWIGFGRCYQEEAIPRTGQRHVKLFSNFTSTDNLSGLFQDAPAFDGDIWRLTAYALTAYEDAIRGDNTAFIKIEFLDASYSWVSQTESVRLDAAMPVDEYVSLAVSAVTPTNAAYIRAALLFEGDAANSAGSIYFDDVVLERISMQPPPPDYSTVTAVDDCDASVIISHIGDTTNSGGGCSGDPAIVTRIWRATDACGDYSEAAQVYTYEDNRAPLVMLPPDIAIDPAASTDPTNTGFAIMAEDVNETATLTYADQLHSLPLPDDSYIDRTWTAQDGCGNVADATQRITLTPDVDGDGMPNAWEIQYGFDPENPADAQDDLDHDGLSNYEEYLYETNPTNADTDGDGMTDGFEALQAGSDPLAEDFDGTYVNVLTIRGADAATNMGPWQIAGDAIENDGYGGSVTYQADVSVAGHYALEADISQIGHTNLTTDRLDVGLMCDGVDVGRQIMIVGTATNGTVRWVLPYLSSGAHEVTFDWRFLWKNRKVRVNELRIQSLGGPDNNQNGVVDWLDHRRASMIAPEAVTVTSLVSPACVEGTSLLFDTLTATSSVGGVVQVRHGVADSWYVDVPLSSAQQAIVTFNGNQGDTVLTNVVTWSVLNILDPTVTELSIREGDALLLNAFPPGATNGVVTISIPGVTSITTSVDVPVTHTFEHSGAFFVNGIWTGENTATGQISVRVISAGFSGSPVAWVDQTRIWNCPNLPPETPVEFDPRVSVTRNPLIMTGVQFRVQIDDRADRFVVARVSDDGPILASTRLRGMDLFSSGEILLRVTDEYADGSRRVESGLLEVPMQDDVRVELSTFTSGVLFDDGTTLRQLVASDFDEIGFALVGFILNPDWDGGICHRLRVYQGDDLVGER